MSHTEEHHRFRLIFPLLKTITKELDYIATMEDLYESFPMADRSTITDTARLFFQSNMSDGFWIEGDLLEPEKGSEKAKKGAERALDTKPRVVVEEDLKELIGELYGEEREAIPEAVDYFIRNAPNGLEGEWTTSLNAFTFVLSLQNVDKDTIYDLVLYLAPRGEITEKDEKTIERAYLDGEQARIENDKEEKE